MKRILKTSFRILIIAGAGVLLFTLSCRKNCCDHMITSTIPIVSTDTVIAITQTTAKSGGKILADGGDSITAKGVCWSKLQSPTIAGSKTSDSSGSGNFTSSITGLNAGTAYYVRAYATNKAGTAYGNQLTFSTLPSAVKPTLTTMQVTNITKITASGGGTITSDGGAAVTARGVCWSISSNPTTADSKTVDGIGTGTFTSNLTNLTAGTMYNVRAYATNIAGTSYGNEINFTTLPNSTVPTLTTTALSNITQITFTSGGSVTADGGASVTARGVCWSTSNNPTLADSHTSDGTGTGNFISQVANLQPNTVYYVRAYATNTAGTAYGNQVSGTTVADGASCPGIPTITYGGQVYHTVEIGTQCWMKENLNIGTMINTSTEQTNNGILEEYCYNDVTMRCSEYGGLYQWGEMVQYLNGASNTNSWNPAPTGNVQGICPTGWHIPTDDEYTILTTYLGGLSVAGGKMKEIGFSHWSSPNTGATNESGYTALPGGNRSNTGGFGGLQTSASFWTVIETHATSGWIKQMLYISGQVYDGNYPKSGGNSVRCVKD